MDDWKDDDLDNGLPDAAIYSPPWYIAHIRTILALASICIVIGFIGFIMIGAFIDNQHFNDDKNEAISIAMQDSSLQSFIDSNAGKDISVDSSAEYDNLQSRSKRQSMRVDIWIFVRDDSADYRTNGPSAFPGSVNRYLIYVDLENNKIISTQVIRVWP
jgi:nitrogen fixation-related uncharacterized protein